jgi:hypothetical protein
MRFNFTFNPSVQTSDDKLTKLPNKTHPQKKKKKRAVTCRVYLRPHLDQCVDQKCFVRQMGDGSVKQLLHTVAEPVAYLVFFCPKQCAAQQSLAQNQSSDDVIGERMPLANGCGSLRFCQRSGSPAALTKKRNYCGDLS